jgi:hypothetical protein
VHGCSSGGQRVAEEQLEGLLGVQAGQRPAQATDGGAFAGRDEQFVAAGVGGSYVGGEDSLVGRSGTRYHPAGELVILEYGVLPVPP